MQKLIILTIALIASTNTQSCLSMAPVCGQNNVTYANACTCRRAQVQVAYQTACTTTTRVETPYQLDVVAQQVPMMVRRQAPVMVQQAPVMVQQAPVVVQQSAPVMVQQAPMRMRNWGVNGNWGWNNGVNMNNWGWNNGVNVNGNWGWNNGVNVNNWGWNNGVNMNNWNNDVVMVGDEN